ncbi:MAG: AMP-binding protein [Thermodesulfobacteriota bacterium]|nr:AMP-binding protein [Thermodesulfobacteriota bacterium]
MNIYSWVDRNAREKPKKTCILYKDQNITFYELDKMASAFATALRGRGIKKGDRIVLMLPNMPEFIISYMAIIEMGGVVIPVNPSYTSRELQHILKDSTAKGIILEDSRVERYSKIKDICPLDIVITTGEGGNFNSWITGPCHKTIEDMDPDDVAVMVYSSGLIGVPMGAMLTHGNLDHNSDLLRTCAGADETDTTLTLIPCFHTFSVSANMLPMLRLGGTIYLMKKIDFKELYHALTDGGVNIINGVPTLFYALLNYPDLNGIDYSQMKALIAGGSALSLEIYNEFKDKFHTDIRQGYGLTEATPVCTVNNIHIKIKPGSIGKTVPHVKARVVDEKGNTLGHNQGGELIFKGPNIMKGYYKRPKETSNVIKNGWLYTGDLGYMDEDGYIYITGYKKDMIITSGFNVYCKEVEAVLNSHPGVKDSAITGEPDLMRGAIIKAYVVKDAPMLTEKQLKSFARTQLASYKAPRKIVFVERIPRDTNGKAILEDIENL